MIRGLFLGATCALIYGIAPLAHPVLAQSTSTPGQSTSAPTTPTTSSSSPTEARLEQLLSSLNLDSHQKKEIDGIKANAEKQVRAIMTPEQLKQFDANISSGKGGSNAYEGLDLTADQKQKLDGVQQMIIQQLVSVLTPEQIQTMMQKVNSQR